MFPGPNALGCSLRVHLGTAKHRVAIPYDEFSPTQLGAERFFVWENNLFQGPCLAEAMVVGGVSYSHHSRIVDLRNRPTR